MAHDSQLSEQERQLEASLRAQYPDEDEHDSGHGYAGGDSGGYGDEGEYGDGSMDESLLDDGEGGDSIDPALMRLNLNGQQLHMGGGAGGDGGDGFGFDDGTLAPDPLHSDGDDPALAMLARSAAAAGGVGVVDELPVFKVGQVIARTKEVISCVRCDAATGHVYMGTYTGNLIQFDFTTQREVWRRSVHWQGKPVSITCLDVCKSLLVLGCSSGATLLYDLDTFQSVQCWTDHTARVSAVYFVTTEYPAQTLVYSTAHDGYFLVRDASQQAAGKILHSFITCTCPLSSLAIESPSVVYLGSWDGQVKRLDLEKKHCSLVLRASTLRESPVRALALAPSPQVKKSKKKGGSSVEETPVYVLIIAHGVGQLKSWDMRTGKVHVESYQGCGDVINALAVFNGLLYAGGDDRSVRCFDVNTGAMVEALSGHVNGITALAIAGVTPKVTPEMEEEAAATAAHSAAGTHRSSSRAGAASASASKGPPRAQGVGNELLISVGFDCQARAYKVAAVEAAIQLRLLKLEEAKALAFEAYVASKSKSKKGKAGSRKGSAKGKKKAGSSKNKSAGSTAGSAAGSKNVTARTGSAGTGRASSAASSSAGSTAAPAKKKSGSTKKKGSTKKAKA